jgi:hypothetical protein
MLCNHAATRVPAREKSYLATVAARGAPWDMALSAIHVAMRKTAALEARHGVQRQHDYHIAAAFLEAYLKQHGRSGAAADIARIPFEGTSAVRVDDRRFWVEALAAMAQLDMMSRPPSATRHAQRLVLEVLRSSVGSWEATHRVYGLYVQQRYDAPEGCNAYLSLIRCTKVQGLGPEKLRVAVQAFNESFDYAFTPNAAATLWKAVRGAASSDRERDELWLLLQQQRPQLFTDDVRYQ